MAADIPSFSKLIPGFDFLENLAKGSGLGLPGMAPGAATAGMPGFGQWVAPTLNPEELGKRIDELKTVQFWLEQNAKLLGATIQALEVQRMTLSTLKTMNVQMGDLRDSMLAPMASVEALKPRPADKPLAEKAAERATEEAGDAPADRPAAAIDPMQWWTALTQQFTQLATAALKDGSAEAARHMAQVDLSAFQVPGAAPASAPAAKKAAAKKVVAKSARTASSKAAVRRR